MTTAPIMPPITPTPAAQPTLKRTLSLWQVTLYGVGTNLGAGIYVLIGEVAAAAGLWAPVSFLMAAVLAALTGLSFAELSSRFPVSAGEAVYVQRAFNRRRLSTVIGLMVVLTGIVSSATLVNGFAGYFREFVDAPNTVTVPIVCLVLGAVAAWGISESVAVAVVITVAEVLGLLLVVAVALPEAVSGAALENAVSGLEGAALYMGVLSGAGIAFYAFIGFEDMVNVAEEVKDVRRVLPRAIVITLAVTAVLYVVVAVVVVRAMPLEVLTSTEAPLAAIYERSTGSSASVISGIALFAVINGALIQVVMAARVLYGTASQGWIPRVLGRVFHRTQTPVIATAVVTVLILAFALWLPLGTLARLTSLTIRVIFAVVNVALVRIKRRDAGLEPDEQVDEQVEPGEVYSVPLWVPIAGAAASAVFVVINFMELMG